MKYLGNDSKIADSNSKLTTTVLLLSVSYLFAESLKYSSGLISLLTCGTIFRLYSHSSILQGDDRVRIFKFIRTTVSAIAYGTQTLGFLFIGILFIDLSVALLSCWRSIILNSVALIALSLKFNPHIEHLILCFGLSL
jgi:hypothetical protein